MYLKIVLDYYQYEIGILKVTVLCIKFLINLNKDRAKNNNNNKNYNKTLDKSVVVKQYLCSKVYLKVSCHFY